MVVRDIDFLALGEFVPLRKDLRKIFLEARSIHGSLLLEQGNSFSSASRALYKCRNANSLRYM